MPPDILEFEEPIAALLREIEALSLLPHTDARERELAPIRRRVVAIRSDLHRTLTSWQRVLVARHPSRPGLQDFFAGFVEIHGDRRFHTNRALAAQLVDGVLTRLLAEVSALDTKTRFDEGYQKFRNIGRLGVEFVDARD